jgi:beta-lactamase class A
MKKNSNFLLPIISIVFFFFGTALGILIKTLYPLDIPPFVQTRLSGYEYINPLIDFETVSSVNKRKLDGLGDKITKHINSLEEKDNKQKPLIGIYYKDLNSGGWFGLNENQKFEPASLLKLATLIVTYDAIQENPSSLDLATKYEVDPDSSTLKQNIPVEEKLVPGQEYTLEEYINQLIIYSDNTVMEEIDKLYRKSTRESETRIYTELGLQNPFTTDEYNIISPKEYSSFFRVLYNATYLNKEMSSKALELLTKTTYDKGLRAGVPENIKIAKKFGERKFTEIERGEIIQLHDCGIIYHPEKPYILCVMTQGKSIPQLEKIIQDISSLVYETVD